MAFSKSFGDAKPVRQEALHLLMWTLRMTPGHVVSMAEIPEKKALHAPAIIHEILHVLQLTTPLNPSA